jgi:hypothetical protein
MMKKIVLLSAFFLFSTVVSAQIEGNVRDVNNKPIPNAKLTATDASGKVTAAVETGARGYYAFKVLKRGKYKIEVKAEGFQTKIVENVEVTVEGFDEESDTRPGPWLLIVLNPVKKTP